MSTQLGRISGALLKDNLLRDGIDLGFETDLLYLDVNNKKIGIKTDSPIRDLLVENTKSIDLIVDNIASINSTITIDATQSQITTFLSDLNITASNKVIATHLGVGDIDFDENRISTTTSNSNLDIRPNGTGILKVINDINIYGNLHSTGNLIIGGDVTFGNTVDDSLTFSAPLDSDLIPNLNATYSLGNFTKKWKDLYAGFLNGEIITAEELTYGSGVVPSTRQGNIWYVAANGSYNNVGNHPNGPFDTIEKALTVAEYGDTVYVYPGTYHELFPLTVPAGVTVKGADLRNTIIVPDTASEFEDVFLLNDECTIQDITIKNFYFDSMNNKGYAFRFAPGINVVNRSPYIQNISVITKGTVAGILDPLGFGSGDAGKGAYIDGSVASINTKEASMLFHSATFITPGVDCITMTNGVRVEWLNSFTYYATRGLYALQGTGRTTDDGSTIRYGAEVRSIGSANVYGTYGAVADGADTLMYLINHNFAYIGTGLDSSNDSTLVIQANETVELNSGKIHYTSFDHVGTFRVGDTFWIDLKNGTTSFDLSSVSVGDLAGIEFKDGDNITYVDFSRIETGNIQIAGNIVRSNLGDLNVASASNEINFDQDVFISKDLDISNNLTIAGQLNLGNQITDTVSFEAEIDDNLDPKLNNTYNIGSITRNWDNIWTRITKFADIEINTNYIRTTVTNSDLELRTNATGTILVEDIRINQNVISTDSGNIQLTPATTLDITSSTTNINGNLHVTNDLYFDSNITLGNTYLDKVMFDARINTNIIPQVTNNYNLGNTTHSWNLYANKVLLDEVEISNNYIRTTSSNLNLELKANGIGAVRVEKVDFNENVILTNDSTNLRIEPATTLDITSSTTNINGNLNVTNNIYFDLDITFGNNFTDRVRYNATVNSDIIPQITNVYNLGNSTRSWNLYTGKILLDEFEINDNYIKTISSNLNFELKANGTGAVRVEKVDFNENIILTNEINNLKIESATTLDITASTTNINGNFYATQTVSLDGNTILGSEPSKNVTINALINNSIIPNLSTVYNLGDISHSWNLYTNKILLDNIEINNNYIRTTSSNLNLELKANGTGAIRVEKIDFDENIIRTNGTTNLEIRPATTLNIFSNTNVNANLAITGNFNFDGTITIGNQTTDTIKFVADVNSNLLPDATDTYNLGSLSRRWKDLYVNTILIDDIEINTNYITTTNGNKNLELYGNGAGGVLAENLRFRSNTLESSISNQNIQISLTGTSVLDTDTTTALRVARGTTANRPTASMVAGDVRFNTIDNLFGGFTSDRVTFGGVYSADRLTYARVEPISNTITFSSQGTTAAYVDPTKVWLNGLNLDSFTVQANTWSTNNIDLVLDPDANNPVEVDNIRFDDNNITNLSNGAITISHITGQGYIKFDGTGAIKIPAGTTAEQPLIPEQGTTRWNTDEGYLEIYIDGTWGLATASAGGFASLSEIEELSDLYALILG